MAWQRIAILSGRLATSRERYDRYGPVSWTRVFGIRIVTAKGPDACGEVLQNRSRAFASGPGWSFLIGLHQMLLQYDWTVPASYSVPIDWSSLPRPRDGLPVRLQRR
jgi:hypothetical protein